MSRRLIVLFLMLWLPLQGWGVSVMPYCRHGGILWMKAMTATGPATLTLAQPAILAHADADDMPCCPHHKPAPCHGHDVVPASCGCDTCSLCHLAGSPAALTSPLIFSSIGGAADLPEYLPAAPEFTPSSFERPPRA
jgi:hypothetical protein